MRYFLIDRITEWTPGERIKGVKNVAMSEDFLEFHFPGNPIMPGVLLLEALAQLAGWLEAASSDFSDWVLLSRVRKCNFYGFVFPGDQVEIECRFLSEVRPGVKSYGGVGTVGGKKKIKAEFEGELAPLSKFENAEAQSRLFRILTRELTF